MLGGDMLYPHMSDMLNVLKMRTTKHNSGQEPSSAFLRILQAVTSSRGKNLIAYTTYTILLLRKEPEGAVQKHRLLSHRFIVLSVFP